MANVELYTTNMCSYCLQAKRLLQARGVPYTEIDVSADPELRADILERTGRRTVPQIFIGGRSIGGYEELVALDTSGELQTLLGE